MLRWLSFLGFAGFLYLFFTLPPERIPSAVRGANDKVLHFLDFFLLALLAYRAFSDSAFRLFYRKAAQKGTGFSLFYGGFLEWIQRTIPGRSASLGDWAADAAGVSLAAFFFFISERR